MVAPFSAIDERLTDTSGVEVFEWWHDDSTSSLYHSTVDSSTVAQDPCLTLL